MSRIPKKAVSILLPIDLYDTLHQLADADGRSFPAEVRQILKGYIEYIAQGGKSWCSWGCERGVIGFHSSAFDDGT